MANNCITLLSGGIDSTSVLYDWLRNTADSVSAVHIGFTRFDRMCKGERMAARNVVVWLHEHARTFKYFEVDYSGEICADGGHSILGVVAAQHISKHGPFNVFIRGPNGDDSSHPGSEARDATLERVLAAALEGLAPVPEFVYPNKSRKKVEILGSLPQDLRDLVISCVNPIIADAGWKPCGQCVGCKRRNELEEALDGTQV